MEYMQIYSISLNEGKMKKYICKRLGIAVLMLLGVTMIIFAIIRLQPGNPFLMMVQFDTDPVFMEQKLQEIGYYDPLPIQYGKWLLRALHFDLGYSIQYNAPVANLIADRFGNTLLLALTSFAISTVIAIGIGVLSALYPNSIMDRIMTLLAFIGVSIPVFFFGLLMIKVLGYDLKLLPFSGIETIGKHYEGMARAKDIAKHLVLPALTSALTQTASLVRYTRASLLETVSEDYIKTAMAKGLTRKQAIIRHGMKNAKLAIITVLCNRIPDLLSGALIVETIFVWPGIGMLNYQAILKQDYPMIMGITLMIAVIVIICNLAADLLYSAADPRIRCEE